MLDTKIGPQNENGHLSNGPFSFFSPVPTMMTPRSLLGKHVHNATQKFTGLLTKPHLRNLREMQMGMLLFESSRLSTIGDAVAAHVTPRKNSERYARTLETIHAGACCERHIRCAAPRFRNEPVLLLGDGGDMQKRHARKMEQVCATADGSSGHGVGRGYPTFAIVAYGTRTKKQLPLCHHLYSTVDPAFKSAWDEQRKCYERCMPLIAGSTHDRIVVEDRGGDDEKRFLGFLEGLQCSFLTRINTGRSSRKLRPVRDGDLEEAVSAQEICALLRNRAVAQRRWYNRKLKKTLTSTVAWQEVRLPDHPAIPLFLVLLYTEGFADPIALLTDIAVRFHEDAWRIFFWYKKRWEVENFFRAIKQNFGAEQFLVRRFRAIQSLAFVQMLAFTLLLDLRKHVEEHDTILFLWFQEFCRKWQRTQQSPLDLLAWIRDAWPKVPSFSSCRSWSYHMTACLAPSPNQKAMFDWREKW